MKKVLSVLLAVCMLAALAVPAFAWGADADVVKAEFDKAEYSLNDILTDNGKVNVGEMLTCYDKNNNRTCFNEDTGKTFADIRAFNSSNNEVLTLDDEGYVTKIMNKKSTDVRITLRVTLASGVQASTVIVVPANVEASGSSGTAYGYRLANAEVKEFSGAQDPTTKNATITWTAGAQKATTIYTFANDSNTPITVTGAKTAAEVAAAIAAAGSMKWNDIVYTATSKGAVVTWTADTIDGDITTGGDTDRYALTDAQKEVLAVDASRTGAGIVGTEDTGTNPATIVVTFGDAVGSKGVSALGYAITLNGQEDGALIATQWAKAFEAKYTKKGAAFAYSFSYYDTTTKKTASYTFDDISVTDAAVTITATASTATATTGLKTDADKLKVVYDKLTANSLKTNNGTDAADVGALKYNIGDEITPILASYKFTDAQKANFEFAVRAANSGNSKYAFIDSEEGLDKYGLHFALGADDDGNPMLVVTDGDDVKAGEFKSGTYVYVRVLNSKFANAQIEKEFRIKLVGNSAAAATTKILPVEKTIGVGQVLDLRTLSDSVKDSKTYWTVEPYGDYQSDVEAALAAKIIMETANSDGSYGWSVKGLAPSVVTIKIYDSYKDYTKGNVADSMKLNIGKGTVAGPSISTTSASVKVGETVALNVKTTSADQYVKWAVSNENGELDVLEGASVKLTGKVAGNVVVTATVYEAKDSKIVEKTLTATVEVKAAEAGSTGSTGATQNPQTGDSIFAHLFF